jgi:hypothetical protein
VARFRLTRLWRRWHRGPWRITTRVTEADQIPDVLPRHGAALVRSDRAPKWLAFDCPCETGHRIMLNLDERRWPRWAVTREAPLTVWPSVDVETDSRRCHYVLRHGRVDWIADREYSFGARVNTRR